MTQPWQVAMSYVGCPFQHMGRSRKGLDCVGLLVLVARDMGWTVKDSPHYGREPARNNNSFQLADYLRANLGEPVQREPQPNDVLLLKLRPRFAPAHVAMVAPHRYGIGMIHTYGEIGKVVYHRIDQTRRAQIAGVYAWPAK